MRAFLVAMLLLCGCGGAVRKAGSCDGPCPASKIQHLVVIVQENHTFDSYFGRYCAAPTGAQPACSDGPGCCEAGPATEPTGAQPVTLDDAANGAYDPNHQQACELDELDGGKLDRFVSGMSGCADARNFAYASPSVMKPYWDLAQKGALADRYFQSIAGQSSSNDMYLARAQFVFLDNAFIPDAIGKECSFIPEARTFTEPTIGDLLAQKGVSWAWYSEGYQAMKDARAKGVCPDAPDACGAGLSIYPCVYDPSDVPFDYYANWKDNPTALRDFARFQADLDAGTLPQVVYLKPIGYKSEHPGLRTTISDGETFVTGVIDAVDRSAYAPDTLVLVSWDEGGGFFDHVPPPPTSVDGQPYGTRVPLLAVGPFARKNAVSHAILEHSSIVRFIEWNWLGMQTGQLAGRDTVVGNLGSLLDGATTGAPVPE